LWASPGGGEHHSSFSIESADDKVEHDQPAYKPAGGLRIAPVMKYHPNLASRSTSVQFFGVGAAVTERMSAARWFVKCALNEARLLVASGLATA
jgi:hypothetical protein